jgi:hypothetical protein
LQRSFLLRKLFVVLLGLTLSSGICAQTRPVQASPDLEVFLLGTAHDLHFRPESHYSLADLRTEVEALHPQLICGEITPEAYLRPMEGYFPPEAAFLAEIAPSLHARFLATDWRVALAWQSRAEQFQPKDAKEKIDAIAADLAKQMAAQSNPTLFDFLHTKAVAIADHQWEELAADHTVSDVAMGSWHQRNRRIVENCLGAARTDTRSIVFVYGAAHIPTLQRELAARGIKAKIADRRFVPAGMGTVPPAVLARWRRNLNNLKAIRDGKLAVPLDSREKVKASHRIEDLELALKTYGAAPEKDAAEKK